MATWAEFSADLRRTAAAKSFGDDNYLEVTIPVNGNRSQKVIVSRLVWQDVEWVSLHSPFALVDPAVDVMKYLRAVSKMPCGALECVAVGGAEWFSIRHSMPLATMDAEDFARPVVAVAQVADTMERDASPHGIDML